MVSDTTLISLTPLAVSLAAASMNHCISAICLSLDSDDGWNSESTHFSASGTPAQATDHPIRAMLAAMACLRNFMILLLVVPSRPCCRPGASEDAGRRSYATARCGLPLAHDPRLQQHRCREADHTHGRIHQHEKSGRNT